MERPTPCLVIDEAIMLANLQKMAAHCHSYGCALRPHVKTHKSVELAKMQLACGASGITVAKIREAEIMADAGITDIFMAYPIVGVEKIRRAAVLAKKIRLILSVDSLPAAKALSLAAEELGACFEVRLELDTGMGRSGAYPADALSLAKEISGLPKLRLTGITTYRNMIYQGKPDADRTRCGLEEGALMVSLAEELRRVGLDIRDVSAGSTATAESCATVPGVTEVRPGTYIFYDKMQQAKEACDETMLAAWVEATVISVKGDLVVIDAGNKSISADCQPDGAVYPGFGEILGHPELRLLHMTEEHGMIHSAVPTDGRIRIGDRLRIVPNHICTTVNLYDHAYLQGKSETRLLKIDARGANT